MHTRQSFQTLGWKSKSRFFHKSYEDKTIIVFFSNGGKRAIRLEPSCKLNFELHGTWFFAFRVPGSDRFDLPWSKFELCAHSFSDDEDHDDGCGMISFWSSQCQSWLLSRSFCSLPFIFPRPTNNRPTSLMTFSPCSSSWLPSKVFKRKSSCPPFKDFILRSCRTSPFFINRISSRAWNRDQLSFKDLLALLLLPWLWNEQYYWHLHYSCRFQMCMNQLDKSTQ